MADAEDRTEAPSARRLQRAREEGDVAVSRELSSLAGLAAGGATLAASWPTAGRSLTRALVNLMAASGSIQVDGEAWGRVLSGVLRPAASLMLPTLAASLAGVVAATLLQSGFLLHPGGLKPDPGRISPLRGAKRLIAPTNLIETAKSVVKLGAFGLVLEQTLRSALPGLVAAGWSLSRAAPLLAHLLMRVVLLMAAVQFAIAAADAVFVRLRRARKLRMTRQELRDEHKETDGNPQIKGRIRTLRRQRARQRMMLAVPKAAVVLTNPTHYAVALAYEQGSRAAPRIVAKGADEVAMRIRALARESRVPLVSNPPLARALFKVPLEQEVPRELFQAVAAVIAYVWRLDRQAARVAG